MINRDVLITPPFVGPYCRSVGAQSTTEPWHADPLALFADEHNGAEELAVTIHGGMSSYSGRDFRLMG